MSSRSATATAPGRRYDRLQADLVIENTTGQVLVEAQGSLLVSTPSAPESAILGMTLSFGVPFIRPGEYKAVFRVDDQNSDKSGTFEMPLTIALPTAKEPLAPASALTQQLRPQRFAARALSRRSLFVDFGCPRPREH